MAEHVGKSLMDFGDKDDIINSVPARTSLLKQKGESMSDYVNPALPLVLGANSGHYERYDDGCLATGIAAQHQLNAAVVNCGFEGVHQKLDAQFASDGRAETLKSQCELEKSISANRAEIILNRADNLREACEIKRVVTEENQRTRDLIQSDIQRRDDQRIRGLELSLALCKQCGCGCGSNVSTPAPV